VVGLVQWPSKVYTYLHDSYLKDTKLNTTAGGDLACNISGRPGRSLTPLTVIAGGLTRFPLAPIPVPNKYSDKPNTESMTGDLWKLCWVTGGTMYSDV